MALKSSDRPVKAEAKLVYLIDEIFSNKLILSDSRCVQFLIRNYDFSRSVHPNLVENMVNNSRDRVELGQRLLFSSL